ncbi:MAG: LemA family protein [Actinomycetaceae bacterium]|nr:LemA family protein [Actinomycetaceae bacterium]
MLGKSLIAVVVLLLAVGVFVWSTHNKLVVLRNRIANALAQVEVQLQRRLDLVPNLVETVKGYAKHESQTLESVVEARQRMVAAQQSGDTRAQLEADSGLTAALRSLFALSERYPDLKASTNFQQLQSQLAETEDKISYMRQSFNDTVMAYNNRLQVFPSNVVAALFKFEPHDSYVADSGAQSAPGVDF